MSSLPTNLEVCVTADSSGITATPETLQVPNGFDGTITWTLTGGAFLNPAITFDGEATPPSFELTNLNTPTTRVRRWGNFIQGTDPFSYYYTLHAQLSTGLRLELDPTVENEPPNG